MSIPVIRVAKITRYKRKHKSGRVYEQAVVTIPRAFDNRLKERGVNEIIICGNDLLFGIPCHFLEKPEGEMVEEIETLVEELSKWLREHYRRGEEVA